MKRLLSIELQKIWKNRASRVLTISYFILLSFIALIASIKFEIGNFNLHLADMGIFNFPYIWHFNTYIADFLNFFLAIVIVSMVANEYSYGTLKQNLIDGMSKQELITSKFLTVTMFAAMTTVYIFVMSLILGYSFSSYTELDIVFSELEYLAAFFVKLVGFFSMCLFLGILVKRSAFAIGFLLLLYIFEGILYGLLRFNINAKVADTVMGFFPVTAMSNLIVEPFSRLAVVKSIGAQIGVKDIKDYDVHFTNVLIVIVWIGLFMFMSYKLLKKRDL
ncbi:MAG: ABC transporter permease [Flavobacterium sp.]|uniref:ABC transporter permease n=1 Tax=Flavobacterium sp. TaxID=239 RepID=UPI00121E20B8|nr:ABC transporter permease [Flavobacterium sp.]RZJ65780.1 MAG: ABC transporter permease [Flavobacterium sp.]